MASSHLNYPPQTLSPNTITWGHKVCILGKGHGHAARNNVMNETKHLHSICRSKCFAHVSSFTPQTCLKGGNDFVVVSWVRRLRHWSKVTTGLWASNPHNPFPKSAFVTSIGEVVSLRISRSSAKRLQLCTPGLQAGGLAAVLVLPAAGILPSGATSSD